MIVVTSPPNSLYVTCEGCQCSYAFDSKKDPSVLILEPTTGLMGLNTVGRWVGDNEVVTSAVKLPEKLAVEFVLCPECGHVYVYRAGWMDGVEPD